MRYVLYPILVAERHLSCDGEDLQDARARVRLGVLLVAPDAAEGSASQDEITRWLELADIALRIGRNEAA
jgi:hypothetical protein